MDETRQLALKLIYRDLVRALEQHGVPNSAKASFRLRPVSERPQDLAMGSLEDFSTLGINSSSSIDPDILTELNGTLSREYGAVEWEINAFSTSDISTTLEPRDETLDASLGAIARFSLDAALTSCKCESPYAPTIVTGGEVKCCDATNQCISCG